jgi:sarcosine oxidase gamma subunit
MNREYFVSHPQDLKDACDDLKGLRYPYVVMSKSTAPKKEHKDEYEKKRKQMAYFFRSITPTYADCAGIGEEQARYELQSKFGRCGEIKQDDSGEFDVVWIEGDKFFVMEQGKKYLVHSIADMNNAELADLIEKSKNYILQQYGVMVKEFINNYKTREV